MNNDLVILLCGVILLLAALPMILMSRAFKGAGNRKGAPAADANPVGIDPGVASLGSAKAKTGHTPDDSGSSSDSGGGDGGGGGE